MFTNCQGHSTGSVELIHSALWSPRVNFVRSAHNFESNLISWASSLLTHIGKEIEDHPYHPETNGLCEQLN